VECGIAFGVDENGMGDVPLRNGSVGCHLVYRCRLVSQRTGKSLIVADINALSKTTINNLRIPQVAAQK
jgi:hypothetical protein